MHLTEKNLSVVRILMNGNPDGSFVDLDQLIERLHEAGHETTKQALQHQLRALIGKGVIEKMGTEKRRDRRRRLLSLTSAAKLVISRSSQ